MEILAKRLRILRKERHLRQEVVAEALGVSISAYRRYELKEREPNAPTSAAMADYFGVSAGSRRRPTRRPPWGDHPTNEVTT